MQYYTNYLWIKLREITRTKNKNNFSHTKFTYTRKSYTGYVITIPPKYKTKHQNNPTTRQLLNLDRKKAEAHTQPYLHRHLLLVNQHSQHLILQKQ